MPYLHAEFYLTRYISFRLKFRLFKTDYASRVSSYPTSLTCLRTLRVYVFYLLTCLTFLRAFVPLLLTCRPFLACFTRFHFLSAYIFLLDFAFLTCPHIFYVLSFFYVTSVFKCFASFHFLRSSFFTCLHFIYMLSVFLHGFI